MRPDVVPSDLKVWIKVFIARMPRLVNEFKDLAFLDLLIFKLPWLNFETCHG
jgi:hypothetical protein